MSDTETTLHRIAVICALLVGITLLVFEVPPWIGALGWFVAFWWGFRASSGQ